MSTVTLALDTATSATTAALIVGGEASEARSQVGPGERPDHSTSLLVLAGELLADRGLGFGDVTRVAVGLGPGTFTGIRIGMSVAQGLAIGGACELVGVGSLRALIEAVRQEPRPVVGMIDARRSELFCSYRTASGQIVEPFTARLGDLCGRIPASSLCVGDGALLACDELRSGGFEVPDADDPCHRVSASVIAQLADTPDQIGPKLVPIYVRDPDAVPAAERSK
jgi:tRNA threonylcarbamoyladenosine biosynthesis protein TsaB